VIRVQFVWERRPSQPAAEALRRIIGSAVTRLGETRTEVHVVVTDDDRIRELNRTWRAIDAPTDVLSFPDGDVLPEGGRLLGEIVISLDAARRQATELGHSELRELQELTLHGVLHLLGYDHEEDDGDMDSLELELREELVDGS
jgi:probable rRNA maturation factor